MDELGNVPNSKSAPNPLATRARTPSNHAASADRKLSNAQPFILNAQFCTHELIQLSGTTGGDESKNVFRFVNIVAVSVWHRAAIRSAHIERRILCCCVTLESIIMRCEWE